MVSTKLELRSFERSILVSLLLKIEDALVLEHFHIFVHAAIQRHAHFPRSREYLWILDRGLIKDMVRVRHRVAFDDMQGVTVKITGVVKPSLIIEIRYIDHQRIAFPTPARVTHPGSRDALRVLASIHRNHAHSMGKLISNRDEIRRRNDFEWIRHISGAGHAG